MKLARLTLAAVCLLAGAPLLPAALLVDPTGGTVLVDDADDWSSDARGIGFAFNFFGTPHTEIYVNSNGNATFSGGDTEYENSPLGAAGGLARIAPFWDDLYMPGGSIVETKGPGLYAVTWLGVDTYSYADEPVTAQLALFGAGNAFGFAPGTIAFSYGVVTTLNDEYRPNPDDGPLDPVGMGVTVGLESGDGMHVDAPGSMAGMFLTLAAFESRVPVGDTPGYLLFTPDARGGGYTVTGDVPEPASVILISSGLALILVRRRTASERG
ncbi:MAG: PEP-CTERM sorting domain-containing protein [Bryobacterales bacterium]|nr:PEP-CTERM sorting domain-containing protein [Bryobacterales bacterium]